jgi:hypothetical protein
MRTAAIGLAALSLIAGRAAADTVSPADVAALTAPLQKLVDAIYKTSTTFPKGVFTRDCIVLDDFAPYRWSGKKHVGDWYLGLVGANAKDHDAFVQMKPVVTLGAAAYPHIADDKLHAYVVFPSTFDFTEDGKRMHQTGQWIISEVKVKNTWLIAGHAWAITAEGPAAP